MNPGLAFLLFMAAIFLIIGSILTVVFQGDRLLVMVLRLIDAPVYPEARMIAALIYRHPEQWKMGTYQMEHPSVGQIWVGHSASGVHVEGKFGRWDPNLIERRIIANAVAWYRSAYIKQLLSETLHKTQPA
jgi:hypothetical protein